jgi:hypothetical protein
MYDDQPPARKYQLGSYYVIFADCFWPGGTTATTTSGRRRRMHNHHNQAHQDKRRGQDDISYHNIQTMCAAGAMAGAAVC